MGVLHSPSITMINLRIHIHPHTNDEADISIEGNDAQLENSLTHHRSRVSLAISQHIHIELALADVTSRAIQALHTKSESAFQLSFVNANSFLIN